MVVGGDEPHFPPGSGSDGGHWNNTEGRGFDTSRCYMGGRRLRVLRSMLPEGMGS